MVVMDGVVYGLEVYDGLIMMSCQLAMIIDVVVTATLEEGSVAWHTVQPVMLNAASCFVQRSDLTLDTSA
jgi:hypothetical protein